MSVLFPCRLSISTIPSRLLFGLLALFALVTTSTYAQPTDEQVIADMTNPSIISVKLTPKNGHKQWNADYGVWEYVRGVEAIKKYPKDENVTIKIVGDAVYQMYGATDYKYWKFRVLSNEYLGMDVPSSEELMEIVQADYQKLFSSYWYNRIIGDVQALYIADEPNFTWHTPNSLSFNIIAEYRAKVSNIHVEDIAQTINVRLYREAENQEWGNFISSRGTSTNTNRVEYTREQMAEMKSLAFIDGERAAAEKASSVTVDDFASMQELAIALNHELVNGTPESVERFFVATLAPMHFVSGSSVQLSARGQQMVNQIIASAFTGSSEYKDQFCDNPGIDERNSSAKRIYLLGIGERAKMQVAGEQYGGGYVDGVKQAGAWKITSIKLYMANSADDKAFFESFSSRDKACP